MKVLTEVKNKKPKKQTTTKKQKNKLSQIIPDVYMKEVAHSKA